MRRVALRALLAIVGLGPWVLPFARAHLPVGRLGVVLDALFATACHRRPERTLVLASVAMPVCSRCAGIFAGLAIGALAAWPGGPPRRLARAGRVHPEILIVLAGVAMLVDVVTHDLGLRPLSHATRLGTGLVFGYALGAGAIRWAEGRGHFFVQKGRHS